MIRELFQLNRYWSKANELHRWRWMERVARRYYRRNKGKIDRQYCEELSVEIKGKTYVAPCPDDSHWTYLPTGSRYEN